jgi:diaminopimelate epimerase
MGLRIAKAHAYGNDFLLCASGLAPAPQDLPAAARRICDRHRGVGADGLIVYTLRAGGAAMQLFNADGGVAELSGNGLRCLAALVACEQQLAPGAHVSIDTGAGRKALVLLDEKGKRFTFRTAMGQPEDLRRVAIPVEGDVVTASVLRMGNPQCIVLGPLPDPGRFNRLGPALATHAMFPTGTNVEFVHVESPDRIRILIWERGVGPTSSSGTGTAASAVAAAAHGGAARVLEVVAPGGAQQVEWLDDGVYLTGWAEMVFDGEWTGAV